MIRDCAGLESEDEASESLDSAGPGEGDRGVGP